VNNAKGDVERPDAQYQMDNQHQTDKDVGEIEAATPKTETVKWLDSAVTFKKCTVLKVSFILLSLFDLLLTILAMYLGLWEMNPLVRFLIHIPVLLVFIKFVFPILVAWIMPGRLLWPSIAALGAVVVWNIRELFVYWL
jgi:hypothetical protein